MDNQLSERFWQKVDVRENDSCWRWLGYITPNGYGKISINNRPVSAHIVSYKLKNGEYDKSLWIDHKCRNRSCVNPYHLRAVTPRMNAIENSESTSAINFNKTHCIHGHEFTEENTRMRKSHGQYVRICKTCYSKQRKEWYLRKRARLALEEIKNGN